MIEHSHLKIIQALHLNGTLTEAANALCLTQSALSHQIRYLEKKLGVSLWQREGKKLRLTQSGELLLQTAQQILPVLEQTEQMLCAYSEGRQGILRIGVECYPCYEWLTGVIGRFLQNMPDVEIDIVNKFQFSGIEGLANHHIDILITPDIEMKQHIQFVELASYQLVALLAEQHELTGSAYISAQNFAKQTLIAFPVADQRLDILSQFLLPARVRPLKIKKIESIELMLQLVCLKRGVCVLPEWLADTYIEKLPLRKLIIGEKGMEKKLYIALRSSEQNIAYIEQFIEIAKSIANKKMA